MRFLQIALTSLAWTVTLLQFGIETLSVDAGSLPSDFSIRYGSYGAELVWSANNKSQVTVGGSRPEFRFTDGTVLGYPLENPMDSLLTLLMTAKEQDLMLTKGQQLEVWYSAKRVDNRAPNINRISEIFSKSVQNNITPTPIVNIDPASLGNYTAKRLTYDNIRGLNYTSFPALIEIVAEVTYPQPLPAKSPLVLFLHGRYNTCYDPNDQSLCNFVWPCDPGCLPIPSHLGYRYVTDILASQGFIAVSISANGINGLEKFVDDGGADARSKLIRRHLNLWARWNTVGGDPWNGIFRDKVDLSNVVLVGHSRGGEGINRAAIDVSASDPYKIVGLVSYAPTALGSQVTPDIHSATILPTCDGDVSDLQGQKYVDRSRDLAYSDALRSAIISVGANHNYFNIEWTPGLAQAFAFDDYNFEDGLECDRNSNRSIRLTPQEQQSVGAAYTMALVRMAVYQDASMLPLLDGSYVRPVSIGRAEVATHAVGGAANRLLYRPEDIAGVQGSSGMVAGECCGYDDSSTILKQCASYDSPHWLSDSLLPSPQASIFRWTNRIGATAIFTVPTGMRDISTLDSINIRVANDPWSTEGARLKIVIQDNLGRNATLNMSLAEVNAFKGSGGLESRIYARALRGNIASVPSNSIDLKNIVYLFLVAQSKSGKIWVLDITASQDKILKPVILDLPIISVESMNDIPEGNGTQSLQMKIVANKPLLEPGSLWVNLNGVESFQFNMTAGWQNTTVLLPLVGDTIYGGFTEIRSSVSIGAITGVVTGNYASFYNVIEDDPFPNITTRKQAISVEGKSLIWRFQLSAPTAGIRIFCDIVPPRTGKELSSDDVPESWMRALGSTPPLIPQPLSSLGLYTQVSFPSGVTKASLVIPIALDNVAESTERIFLDCFDIDSKKLLTLVGTVRAHNTTT